MLPSPQMITTNGLVLAHSNVQILYAMYWYYVSFDLRGQMQQTSLKKPRSLARQNNDISLYMHSTHTQ